MMMYLIQKILLETGSPIRIRREGQICVLVHGNTVISEVGRFSTIVEQDILSNFEGKGVVHRHLEYNHPRGGLTGYSLMELNLSIYPSIQRGLQHLLDTFPRP